MSFEDRSWSEAPWEDADGVWEGDVEPEESLSFLTWASKIFTAVSRDASLPVEVPSRGGYVWTVTLTSPTLPVIR